MRRQGSPYDNTAQTRDRKKGSRNRICVAEAPAKLFESDMANRTDEEGLAAMIKIASAKAYSVLPLTFSKYDWGCNQSNDVMQILDSKQYREGNYLFI